MSLSADAQNVRVNVQKIVNKSKLGKIVAERYLEPILQELEDAEIDILFDAGEFIVTWLKTRIQADTSTGGTYKVYEVDFGAGEGAAKNSYELLGEYKSSGKGNPPAWSMGSSGLPTGTLLESISFQVSSKGVSVGIFNSRGTEMRSAFFRGGKLFVSDQVEATPVEEYANILDNRTYANHRPWLKYPMAIVKEKVRKRIKNGFRKAIKRATSGASTGQTLYYRMYYSEED